MFHSRPFACICGSIFLALAVGAAAGPAPGERFPAVSLPRADGGSHSWRPGRITVFSFVAFWCETWKPQSARLGAARKALAGLPVEFVTVSIDGRWAEQGKAKVEGPVLLDSGGAFGRGLGVRAVPYTVVVDRSGRVRHASQGVVRGEALQETVRALVNGEAPKSAGTVYLTFDDFPAREGDDELLDLLRAEGVPATFFCLGRNVAESRELARRAAREGHALQIHSWDHDAASPQLERCARLLTEVAGRRPDLYRPPGSAGVRRLTGGQLCHPVANPYDYTRPGEAELRRRILLAAKPGGVVLLHSGVGETRAALPGILRSLRERGLGFGTLR